MNKGILWTALAASILGVSGGYWLASTNTNDPFTSFKRTEKKPVFYRHPPPRDGGSAATGLGPVPPITPPVTSNVPAKDERVMDSIPVYKQSGQNAKPVERKESSSRNQKGKILYYRHPMGLRDTSPVPKKDSMGMDYIPVYAEEENLNEPHVLRFSTEKIQRLGVKTALVENTEISKTVRSVGIVEADERRLHNVTLRFDGFIEKLFVNATGQPVSRGEPLLALYSPDLVSAQNDYLIAQQSQVMLAHGREWLKAGIKSLTDSSFERLKNWDISSEDLVRLQQGKVLKTLLVRSPASGVIIEKTAIEGARAMAGDTLYKIADLSEVWIMAEVYEQDIGLIKLGQTVRVNLDAYPGLIFTGKVGFIYPMLDTATRTIKVRIELANTGNLFKPMMYAQVQIDARRHRALIVPNSAVLESGRRTLVIVDRGEGRFEPRPVKLGLRGEDMSEILEGLHEQESVVVSANFLIDAESNLKAGVSAFESDNPKQDRAATPKLLLPDEEHGHRGGM